ncbi:MAG: MBL fold metallo-hydrolase [Nevskia sp.]|nr:MBL fold metallo-hydrolase [Nevskia sp.]
MIRFAYLGSGSKGNAAVVSTGGTTILLDCGLGLRETEQRLERLGLRAEELSGILVTHEHADHIAGVAPLAQRYRLPVWITAGSVAGWKEPPRELIRRINPHDPFRIGELQVRPYPVPHDAREPCQFVFGDGRFRLGVLTDAGSVTAHMRRVLSGCDALLLEFNHELEMLRQGPYPPPLKRRVAGDHGHLSNAQAADLLASLDRSRLQHLVLTHISETNNTPQHALRAAAGVLNGTPEWLTCAHQQDGLAWRELR